MRTLTIRWLVAVLILAAPAASRAAPPAGKSEALSRSDRALLDRLLKDVFFDPQGAEFVQVNVSVRTDNGGTADVARHGWLKTGAEGKEPRVYFTDGESIAATAAKKTTKTNFVEFCRNCYMPPEPTRKVAPSESPQPSDQPRPSGDEAGGKDGKTAQHEGDVIELRMHDVDTLAPILYPPFISSARSFASRGDLSKPLHDLALAAWLYRLDEPYLAALALEVAQERRGWRPDDSDRDERRGRRRRAGRRWGESTESEGPPSKETADEAMVRHVREGLAEDAFTAMFGAFRVRADEEALEHAERLASRYPDVAMPQSREVLADLKRRKRDGHFGKGDVLPANFSTLDEKQRIAAAIKALDEVDGDPRAYGRRIEDHVYTKALIGIGDAAVMDLLVTIESDTRLTRMCEQYYDGSRYRYRLFSVREAALPAVMAIIKLDLIDGEPRDAASAAEIATQLRAYWKAHGGLPFDDRMMQALTDASLDPCAWYGAARRLAEIEARPAGITAALGGWIGRSDKSPNPVIAKFSNPTVAEAILVAMDRSLSPAPAKVADSSAANADPFDDHFTQRASRRPRDKGSEESYLWLLVRLGDRRIAKEIGSRYAKAQSFLPKRIYACAAKELGDREPTKSFAAEIEKGHLPLPTDGEDNWHRPSEGTRELGLALRLLLDCDLPECGRALDALANPKHPYFSHATEGVIGGAVSDSFESYPWHRHPFCLRILRPLLDTEDATGIRWAIKEGNLDWSGPRYSSSRSIPDFLSNPQGRLEHAEERVCDRAALALSHAAFGVPAYHPLFKDRDTRLVQMRQTLARYRFRAPTAAEASALVTDRLLPDIPPLAQAATAEDVKAGRAIYSLDGQGQRADVALPAVGTLKAAAKAARPARGGRLFDGPPKLLIVQAEVDAQGKVKYGAIAAEGLLTLDSSEVINVQPLPAEKR